MMKYLNYFQFKIWYKQNITINGQNVRTSMSLHLSVDRKINILTILWKYMYIYIRVRIDGHHL